MRRVLILAEYDGTGFAGLQRQRPGLRTVQGELEGALGRIGALPKAVAAGRTDAGVHALAMPFHFDLPGRIPTARIPEALNRFLPQDLKVLSAREVAPDFHARKDALWRAYRYRLLLRPHPSPLLRGRALWVGRPLDLAALREALPLLLGRHNFLGFAREEVGEGVRELYEARLEAAEGELGPELHLYFRGRSFLRGQVRGMVGTLLEVGLGKRSPESLRRILEEGDRRLAGPSAPPQGLYFLEAAYPEERLSPSATGSGDPRRPAGRPPRS
ncbi:tRNA pseudouridine(38-40) synthase TruA [Thermus thermamylovorans]|uniref:tRNA pseudouridine synthase A n=1 Tax=Thermus thermamylovorans TaxID=2509362 RepID=A0A4Q9B7N3_9DEIN|nr:tRNA pseudouridine(38-40) synthase TruA [Thermus thermamylovorans]TBH21153.1 tRNA pseudouridine(38-40) synthase TruA [Thermus thermamylovorans]